MSKLANTITLLELLATGRKYSIKELSLKLEVSNRMIRVYKDDLEKAGIYIDSIMGPYGGYVLNRSINLPIRRFTNNDFLLLDSYILNEPNIDKKNKLMLLQEKIKGIYISDKETNNNLNFKGDKKDKYNILMRAIKEKRKVRILYYSFNKGENKRVIDPASMFLFNDGWYVAAHCELRGDIRHFELKRILELELLEEKYI